MNTLQFKQHNSKKEFKNNLVQILNSASATKIGEINPLSIVPDKVSASSNELVELINKQLKLGGASDYDIDNNIVIAGIIRKINEYNQHVVELINNYIDMVEPDIFSHIDNYIQSNDQLLNDIDDMQADNHLLYNTVVYDITDQLDFKHDMKLGAFKIKDNHYAYGVLAESDSQHNPYGYFIMYIDTNNNIRGYVPLKGNALNGDTFESFYDIDEDEDDIDDVEVINSLNILKSSNDKYVRSLGYRDFQEYTDKNQIGICMSTILAEIRNNIK